MESADFLIVGGGIAGASTGYWLARAGKVALLERESQPGYHTTGRSAALFWEGYGTPQVRALTCASRPFLSAPPVGFSDHPILAPRGTLIVAARDRIAALDAFLEDVAPNAPAARRIDGSSAIAMVPVLRPEAAYAAIHEPDAFDIDVHALHQGYLRGIRAAGGTVLNSAGVTAVERDRGGWRVESASGTIRAEVLIDAAGAWCDELADMAGVPRIGLVPKRRSAFVFQPPPAAEIARWPMFIDVDESFYVKPDAGMLLGSPANADPTHPQDVQPEELDIAIGIDRIQSATTLAIPRPTRTWAGLRSFVADGDLVGGFDPDAPGFFWVAAQGGYGIQTSAAMGEACAALAAGRPIPAHIADHGITPERLGPGRLRHR